jgi:hypothetical protein
MAEPHLYNPKGGMFFHVAVTSRDSRVRFLGRGRSHSQGFAARGNLHAACSDGARQVATLCGHPTACRQRRSVKVVVHCRCAPTR